MTDENTTDETIDEAAPVKVDEHLLASVIDAVRPSLQADGGDVTLVGVDEQGVVTVELVGACAGCPMSQMTLSMGIERVLKEHVPGVTRVQAMA